MNFYSVKKRIERDFITQLLVADTQGLVDFGRSFIAHGGIVCLHKKVI